MVPALIYGNVVTKSVYNNVLKYKKTAAIIFVVVVILIFFKKKIKAIFSKGTLAMARSEINKKNLTYNETQYKSFADSLQAAMDVWGTGQTDEEAIYNIMKKMQTVDDVLALIAAFGERPYLSFFGFSEGNYPLSKWLTRELDLSEINTVNTILKNKGINFNF